MSETIRLHEALAISWACSVRDCGESAPATVDAALELDESRATIVSAIELGERIGRRCHWLCPTCGPHATISEDGCCATCGAGLSFVPSVQEDSPAPARALAISVPCPSCMVNGDPTPAGTQCHGPSGFGQPHRSRIDAANA